MILLDTHAWVWWVSSPDLLSATAQKAIDDAVKKNSVFISSISSWEVALLVKQGRLELDRPVQEWIAATEMQDFCDFVPISNAVAIESVNLPEPLHRDPADRMIIATARIHRWELVTKDGKMHEYPHITTLW